MRMDITNKCNLRCNTCYFSINGFRARGAFMSPDQFGVVCEKLAGRAHRLGFSCAFEPLIHPQFNEILKHLPLLGECQTAINTNGLLLNKTLVRNICESELQWLSVSLDGATQDTNALVRNNSCFTKIIERMQELDGLRKAMNHGPKIQVSFTLLQDNMAELPNMVDLCLSFGADRLIVRHVISIAGCPMSQRSCLHFPERTTALIEEARKRAADVGLDIWLPVGAPRTEEELVMDCKDPFESFYIYSDGECYPCTFLADAESCGNIQRDSVDGILHAKSISMVRKRFRSGNISKTCMTCLRDMQNVGIKEKRHFTVRFED